MKRWIFRRSASSCAGYFSLCLTLACDCCGLLGYYGRSETLPHLPIFCVLLSQKEKRRPPCLQPEVVCACLLSHRQDQVVFFASGDVLAACTELADGIESP